MTEAAPAPGAAALHDPARLAELESWTRREAQLRRLGRLAGLRPESVTAYLGPGVERAGLWAKLFGCRTVVVDRDPAGLAELGRNADRLGVAKLLSIHELDPLDPQATAVPEGCDLILAQGLAGAVGFDAALETLRKRLATYGLLAVYQRAWITRQVSPEVRRYWEPRTVREIRTVRDTLERFPALGLEPITCELVPARAWDEHYERVEGQLAALCALDGPETEVGRALAATREAQRVHQAGGKDCTSIGCFVGRRVEPGAPPRWPRHGSGE